MQVRNEPALCYAILGIWSWSLLQFTLVLTATRVRKDRVGGASVFWSSKDEERVACCSSDVFGIMVSIAMEDGPFLILRLLLIIEYRVISYTNMFFTCKNSLVIQ